MDNVIWIGLLISSGMPIGLLLGWCLTKSIDNFFEELRIKLMCEDNKQTVRTDKHNMRSTIEDINLDGRLADYEYELLDSTLDNLYEKAALIEQLEAEKYTEDQGMDNEMEQFNHGLDAAIKAVREA